MVMNCVYFVSQVQGLYHLNAFTAAAAISQYLPSSAVKMKMLAGLTPVRSTVIIASGTVYVLLNVSVMCAAAG